MLERDPQPRHAVCGEFLSIEAQAELVRLGIDLDRYGASRITTLRLVHGDVVAEADLPFIGRGLSRKVLDEALRGEAVRAGARLLRGVPVRSLTAGPAANQPRGGPPRRDPGPNPVSGERQARHQGRQALGRPSQGRFHRVQDLFRPDGTATRRPGRGRRDRAVRGRLCRPAARRGWPGQFVPPRCAEPLRPSRSELGGPASRVVPGGAAHGRAP